MTVKLKITTKRSLKRLTLGMVTSFLPQSTCKRVEGYGKNWTHFMSKLDNLFQSIRVSDENSSVTLALHFFKLIWTPDFFVFLCTIQSDVINFQHFLTSFAIFQSFTDLFRELNDREIENHYKTICEKVETWHGIIISPTVHVQKSRGLRQKLDALRVQTGQYVTE